MKIIEKEIETFIVEKKSKFIANIFYIENKLEAEKKIKEIKKKFFDAKHNCYAYRIMEDDSIYEKFSDDGEPSGTAGKPMLDIIKGNNLINCLVVVTRYFGGILLGTGGLVRAYSEAFNKGLEKIKLFDVEYGNKVEIVVDYKNSEMLNYFCRINNIKVLEKEYGENIKIIVEVNDNLLDKICNDKDNSTFKIIDCRKMSKKLIRKYS